LLIHNRNKNISKFDQFRAYIVYGYRLFASNTRAVLTYRRIYRNYGSVIIRMLRNQYPIEATSRKGDYIILHNRSETGIVTRLEYLGCKDYEITDNKITIPSLVFGTNERRKLELYDAVTNGDPFRIFFDKVYDFLPTDGKTVIDIGANIGDSSVYFALRKSPKIIAIEPFPRNYQSAKKNIELNGFADKITLQLAGCAAESGDITVDPSYESNDSSWLLESKQGIKVPLVTLRDIIIEYNVSKGEAVLKMDCEGCEYDTILTSTPDTLRFFSHIQLEYHQGYKNLKEKLERCGFDVSVTRPLFGRSVSMQGKTNLYTGYIYAIRSE
jgi:FkbM family methyltransferase